MTSDQGRADDDSRRIQLQDLLDETLLDNGYIMQFVFDLFHNELAIRVRVPLSHDDVREHHIVFSGIRALFYQNEILFPSSASIEDRRDPVVGLVWSWIGYNFYDRPVTIRLVDAPHGLEGVGGVSMNFTLDILISNGVLLIAASGISIDGEYFDVGIPPKPEP